MNSARILGIDTKSIPFKLPSLELDMDALESAVSERTKAIVVCTPSNPSGKMFTSEELQLIGDFVKKHDLIVLADEIYEYFTFDDRKHISPAAIEGLEERTITLMGFSKTFSITGWRIGYVHAPDKYSKQIALANDLLYVCAPTPLQYAVLSGMDEPPTYYEDLKTEFAGKRKMICEALTEGGFSYIEPQGAYYILADHSSFGFKDSYEAAIAILEKVKVTGIPGRAFFNQSVGENYVRFCFSLEDDILSEACDRISRFKGEM